MYIRSSATGAAKLSKNAKKRLKAQHEAAIRAAEVARLSGDAAPTNATEFERLLVGNPNSSYLWIKYMAHLLSLGEIDAARAVAQRALDTINIREQGEKFNVWVAWLNLENVYGSPSPEEALMGLFQRGLQYCDQKALYMALLGILQKSGRGELMQEVLKTMCKKFGGSAKVRGGWGLGWRRGRGGKRAVGGEGGHMLVAGRCFP